MTISAQSLVDDIRVMSGLRNNPLFSDPQICELVNDAYGELADKFVASLQHWFRAVASFTLAGNSPTTNTFDLSTLPDFQMDQGLNWLPSGPTGMPVPVNRLGSFAERGSVPGYLGNISGARRYFTNGDLLFIEPYSTSAGQYQLIYTPQRTPLAIGSVDLPALLTPWALFLKVHASIAIRASRQQPTNDLQPKLAEQLARITAMAKKRTEGPQQAPITNYRRRRPVGYWGW